MTRTPAPLPDAGVRLVAYRVCLDPNVEQMRALERNAGAARAAFNYALARRINAHRAWRARSDELTAAGTSEADARRLASSEHPQPTARGKGTGNKAIWLAEHAARPAQWDALVAKLTAAGIPDGEARIQAGTQLRMLGWGVTPEGTLVDYKPLVSSYAISSGMDAADAAFKNWFASVAGRRKGKPIGYPRFKKKGRSREAFKIFHDVKKPTIRVEDARHVRLPSIGLVRLHSNLRRLVKLARRDPDIIIRSVTIAREGARWYASLLVAQPWTPPSPTRRQLTAGTVGVDLGVSTLAALSTGETISNPRFTRQWEHRLTQAQQAYARTQCGSQRCSKARRRIGRIQAAAAAARTGYLHQATAHLAKTWSTIVIEDLNIKGMTASARGTIEQPGRRVRQKAGLNKAILDAAPGEFRRQLTYKTLWQGSSLIIADRWYPSTQQCHACGHRNPTLTLKDRVFHCPSCGTSTDRDLNAALNLAALATPNPDGIGNPDAAHASNTHAGGSSRGKPSPPNTRDRREPEAQIGTLEDGRRTRPKALNGTRKIREDPRGHPPGAILERSTPAHEA